MGVLSDLIDELRIGIDTAANETADFLGPGMEGVSDVMAPAVNALGGVVKKIPIVGGMGEWMEDIKPFKYNQGDFARGIESLRNDKSMMVIPKIISAVANVPIVEGGTTLGGFSSPLDWKRTLGYVGGSDLARLLADESVENQNLPVIKDDPPPSVSPGTKTTPEFATESLRKILDKNGVITMKGDALSEGSDKRKGVSRYQSSDNYEKLLDDVQFGALGREGQARAVGQFQASYGKILSELRNEILSDRDGPKQRLALSRYGIDPKVMLSKKPEDLQRIDAMLSAKAQQLALDELPGSARRGVMRLMGMSEDSPKVSDTPVQNAAIDDGQEDKESAWFNDALLPAGAAAATVFLTKKFGPKAISALSKTKLAEKLFPGSLKEAAAQNVSAATSRAATSGGPKALEFSPTKLLEYGGNRAEPVGEVFSKKGTPNFKDIKAALLKTKSAKAEEAAKLPAVVKSSPKKSVPDDILEGFRPSTFEELLKLSKFKGIQKYQADRILSRIAEDERNNPNILEILRAIIPSK